MKTYWEKVADDFHTLHPTVTIKISAIETNDLQRNKIPAALLSGNPPDIFQAWGGGEIAEQVKSGYLKDITADTKGEVASIGAAANIWAVDGKQYGLPFDFGIEGFWYNKDPFTQGRHHRSAGHHGRPERRHRQAQGQQDRPDRGGRR